MADNKNYSDYFLIGDELEFLGITMKIIRLTDAVDTECGHYNTTMTTLYVDKQGIIKEHIFYAAEMAAIVKEP